MTWAVTAISAAAMVSGAMAQQHSSNLKQKALSTANLSEQKRQRDIMLKNADFQKQQQDDQLKARQVFQEQGIKSFDPNAMNADAADQQSQIAQALNAAQNAQPIAITGSDSGAASIQTVGANPLGSSGSNTYQNDLANKMAYNQAYGEQQANAQAALAALDRSRLMGAERLQRSGEQIGLSAAQLQALNYPMQANQLLSNASQNLYASDAQRAQLKGGNWDLAGKGLSMVGQIGMSAAAGGGFSPGGAGYNTSAGLYNKVAPSFGAPMKALAV